MNQASVPDNLKLRFEWRNGAEQPINAEYSYIKISKFISDLVNDIGSSTKNGYLPIVFDHSMITPETMSRIVEWCKKYHESPYSTQDETQKLSFTVDTNVQKPSVALEQDIDTFMKMDHETLLTTLMGANYLNIQPLVDVACQAIARTISGKSAEEIRKLYNIPNDFTREEEDQIRRENAWAEDR